MENSPVRRPGIGIAVDRHKLKAYRESALLERIDVSDLSKLRELRLLAAESDIPGYSLMSYEGLCSALTAKGVTLPVHPGISRDAIAKIENGDRARPKISTLRTLIDTLNYELERRGLDTIRVEDVYAGPADGPRADGEVAPGH